MMTIKIKKYVYERTLLFLSVSTRALVGQISEPYCTVRYGTLKAIAVLVAKIFWDLSPSFLNFFSK